MNDEYAECILSVNRKEKEEKIKHFGPMQGDSELSHFISPAMRDILVDWLFKVATECKLKTETFLPHNNLRRYFFAETKNQSKSSPTHWRGSSVGCVKTGGNLQNQSQ
jgi:hypothetical protein